MKVLNNFSSIQKRAAIGVAVTLLASLVTFITTQQNASATSVVCPSESTVIGNTRTIPGTTTNVRVAVLYRVCIQDGVKAVKIDYVSIRNYASKEFSLSYYITRKATLNSGKRVFAYQFSSGFRDDDFFFNPYIVLNTKYDVAIKVVARDAGQSVSFDFANLN